jgi:hypothetical protein
VTLHPMHDDDTLVIPPTRRPAVDPTLLRAAGLVVAATVALTLLVQAFAAGLVLLAWWLAP